MAGLMTLMGRVQRINEQVALGEITEQATIDMKAITRQMGDAKAEIVGLCAQRWEGIRDPDNPDTELAFPDGIGALDEEDFEALFNGCLDGVSEGRVDPKAGPAGSSGTSSPPSMPPNVAEIAAALPT